MTRVKVSIFVWFIHEKAANEFEKKVTKLFFEKERKQTTPVLTTLEQSSITKKINKNWKTKSLNQ